MSKMEFNLQRFKNAQKRDYKRALAEIKRGRKETHWIWYIFPQLAFLGKSEISAYYAIRGIEEARAYMKDRVLRKRIIEISQALLDLDTNDATEVMGFPDDKKLQSSMTLFEAADPDCEVFSKVLEKFFGGERDLLTLYLLEQQI